MPVSAATRKSMLGDVEKLSGPCFLRNPNKEDAINMRCLEVFKDIVDVSDSYSESDDGAEDKKGPPEYEIKSLQIITDDDGTIVVPPFTVAKGSFSPSELAVRNEVAEHLSSVVMLLNKVYNMHHNLADPLDQLKFVIDLSALSPLVETGESHFGMANMPASVIHNTISTYNNGRTDE